MLTALTTAAADANHDGVVTTEELRRYVAVAVPERTHDRQHPTVDRDNLGAALPRRPDPGLFGLPLPP